MSEDRDKSTHIAVIGMDGRFPGARNLKEFWANLEAGVDATRELSDAELLAAGESRTTIADPAYVRRCAYLDDTEMFDARFFGIAPRDAAVMDPQHRLFLEIAWGAWEDAGYDSSRCSGSVGVFAGSGMSYYAQYNVLTNKKLVGEMGEWLVRHTANDRNFLSTLASYKMDLTGPSMNVQTACSSALVAIHVACQSLLNRECDYAIAGGSTINFPQRGYKYEESEILSRDGRCRTFDVESDGTVFGSGVGAVVLKRLEDALADGDVIDAVICGSAINNDGANKVGFLAPGVEGQTDAILQALEVAEIDPSTIDYVETHGTGTVIGDPIEVASLRNAYTSHGQLAEATCGLGSVKTNIGHLGEAAGVASFIKVCLAMRHGVLPATLHFTAPNPQLELSGGPFYVVSQNREWMRRGGPRRAAVTALGAGGTNAHVILEEPPEEAPQRIVERTAGDRADTMLLLSAKSPGSLQMACAQLAEHLQATPELSLYDVAFTLREGRRRFAYRKAVYATDPSQAAEALREAAGGAVSGKASAAKPRLTFMFPGGGAQYSNMGRELYEKEPVYRAAVDECAAYALPLLQFDIRTLMFCEAEQEEAAGVKLESPRLSLPALFTTSYALSKLLLSFGLEPDAMIGHSMGEYVAACLAEVFSPLDGLALVIERGRLFEQVEVGGMLALQLSASAAREFMGDDLAFAAINAPGLCVASGPVGSIDALQARLAAEEIDCRRVRINVAAHSHLLEPILPAFRRFCEKIQFQTPTRPFVSNLTGAWADPEEVVTPEYWVRHLRNTVQFEAGLATIFAPGETVLLEVGPGRTLASVARVQSPPSSTASVPVALPTLRHPNEKVSDVSFLLQTLGKVWAAGREIAWDSIFINRPPGRRVHLPTYPFERERYWIDADKGATSETELVKRADVGDWFHLPAWQALPAFVSPEAREKSRQWLVFTDQVGVHGRLRPKLKGRVISVCMGMAFSRMGADIFEVNPSRPADLEDLLSSLDMDRNTPLEVLYLWPVTLRRSKLVAPPFEEIRVMAFDGLLSLLQAAADMDGRIRLHVVANGVFSVNGEAVDALKSLALGPVRVGAREVANVSTRLLDWDYDPIWDRLKEAPLDALYDELILECDDQVVALRHEKRWVERLCQTHIPQAHEMWLKNPHGKYLITGGFGGIGREVASELSRQGKPTLVLVGRTALPAREH